MAVGNDYISRGTADILAAAGRSGNSNKSSSSGGNGPTTTTYGDDYVSKGARNILAAAGRITVQDTTPQQTAQSLYDQFKAASEKRIAEAKAATLQAEKEYKNYISSPEALVYQKNYGRPPAKANELQSKWSAARLAQRDTENEATITRLAQTAALYQDDKSKHSEVDKQRAVKLGTKDNKEKRLLDFRTTETQRQQKMGYSTWDTEKYQSMTEDETEIYNRLAKNGYEREAQEFLDALDSSLNYRVTKSRTDAARHTAQSGVLGGIGASAGSTLLNVLGTGITAELEAIRAMRNGEVIDQYAEKMYGRNLSTILRSTVSESVGNWAAMLPTLVQGKAADSGKFAAMPAEKQQESNRKIAEFLYNTGMSMVDMVAMSPMGSTGMSLIMGTNAAGDTLIDAKNRGLTDEQAMAMSIISGAAEVLAEKYSLDRLFDGKVSTSTLKTALTQGGVEASEEMVTELANTLADVFIAGDQSAFETAMAGYEAEGMTYEQAQSKAFFDVLADIAAAGAAGFLSGAVMGGIMDTVSTNAQGRSLIDQATEIYMKQGQTQEQARQNAINYLKEELRAVGALADEDTTAYKLSQQTGDMTTGDMGRAYIANKEEWESGGLRASPEYTPEKTGISIERQTEFDDYVQNALAGADNNESKAFSLSKVDNRIVTALNERGVKIKDGAWHEITDNDIRHINNSHGISKDGQYGITTGDLQAIPLILNNADTVYYYPYKNGRQGVLYVMDHVDTTYYVEQILNDDTLTGKQMIKAPLGEVPEIYKDVINKNEVLTASLDGVSAPGMYAQDVTQPSTSETNIPNSAETVNTEATIPERIEQLQQRLNELPMELSREGINIQRQIAEMQARQEAEIPEVSGTDVTDRVAGSDEIPKEVKESLTNRKREQRKHEQFKKRLNLDPEVTNKIEVFVKNGVSLGEAVSLINNVQPQMVADYYNSYREYNEISRKAEQYRKTVLNNRYEAVKSAIGEGLYKWKDKKNGLSYSRMTQERIIREIAENDPVAAKWVTENIFEPVHANEAAKIRWMNEYSERARAYNMTKTENEMVHVLITEQDITQRLEENESQKRRTKQLDGEKKQLEKALDYVKGEKADLFLKDNTLSEERCRGIADDFLSMYREIYERLTGVQIKNGMPVTEFRNTYVPYVKDKKGRTVLSYIGVELGAQELPTSIAGLTEFFKPGKPWFSHDLSRTGYRTAFDILGGLDEYLGSAGDVIFHTDDIQNIRMLENVIRSATTAEGQAETIKEWIDAGITGDELYSKMQETQIENTHLSNYVRNLTEYGNLLANKKSAFDRGFENLLGRSIYKTMNGVKGRIMSNVIGGNVSVILSQLIPLTQATSVVSYKNLARGIAEAGKAYVNDDGFNSRSTFVTNRMGYEQAGFKDAVDRITDAIAKPFEVVDEVVASAIVRGRYYDNLAKGMNEKAAMRDADTIAAALIADRSKGALPTIFGSKNPISTLITTFQVESNNQLDFMFKDLKLEANKDTTKAAGAAMAMMLTKMFIAAFVYDELRKLMGLSANAFDPINWVRDVSEEVRKGIDEEQKLSETVSNIWDATSDQIPFIGGGRYGTIYENALPDMGEIADAIQNVDADGTGTKYLGQVALQELSKPVLYLGLPTGGAQVNKTIHGIKTLVQGGSYSYNKDDEKRLQYTANPTLGNIVSGVLFGKSGIKENKEWKASGFDSFSEKEKDSFASLKTHGGNATQFGEYRALYKSMVEADTEKNKTLKEKQAEIENGNLTLTAAEALERAEMDLGYTQQNSALKWAQQIARDASLTNEQKADLIAMADFSAADVKTIKKLTEMGVPVSNYVAVISKIADMGLSTGDDLNSEAKKAVTEQVHDMNLTVEQKTALVRQTVGDNWVIDFSSEAAYRIANDYGKNAYEKYAEAKNACGMTAEQYIDFKDKEESGALKGSIDGKTIYYLKQCRLANYVDSLDASETVKKYIWDSVYNEDDDCEYENRHNKLKQVDGVWYTSGGYN